jgi:membrane protease YdiL (CAAX protease family)
MIGARRKLILQTVVGAVALLVTVFIAAVVVGYLDAKGASIGSDTAAFWIIGAFAVVAMVGGFAVGAQWMRSIDEAAREAHKSAWYWGGSAGMSIGGVVVIMASLERAATVSIPSFLPGRTDPAAYAATGAFAMLLIMLAGYAIVWAWWWLSRSRG